MFLPECVSLLRHREVNKLSGTIESQGPGVLL